MSRAICLNCGLPVDEHQPAGWCRSKIQPFAKVVDGLKAQGVKAVHEFKISDQVRVGTVTRTSLETGAVETFKIVLTLAGIEQAVRDELANHPHPVAVMAFVKLSKLD